MHSLLDSQALKHRLCCYTATVRRGQVFEKSFCCSRSPSSHGQLRKPNLKPLHIPVKVTHYANLKRSSAHIV